MDQNQAAQMHAQRMMLNLQREIGECRTLIADLQAQVEVGHHQLADAMHKVSEAEGAMNTAEAETARLSAELTEAQALLETARHDRAAALNARATVKKSHTRTERAVG